MVGGGERKITKLDGTVRKVREYHTTLACEADLAGGKRQGKGVLITGGSQVVLFSGNDK